ncbi:MAG: hypothetical protein MR316_08840 [Lachnospiraceae bacterium]|nr:hypothetical protein [Lachnospiraceae bacterium]
MIRRKKIALLCVTAMVVSSLFTACGKNEKSTKAETQTVQVTKVNGNTVTATVGTISEKQDGQGGSAPEGTPPAAKEGQDGNAPQGTPPAAKDGQDGSAPQSTPSADSNAKNDSTPEGTPSADSKGDNSSSDQGPQGGPMGGGSTFEAGEETITFELTDSTKITLEQLQGSADGTKDDIVENAVLEVTLDKNSKATKIVVKNLQAGNGFGGSDEVTNGTAANTISSDDTVSSKSYESTGDDENAVRVDGAKVTMTDATINKSGGDSSNTENGDFYGANAGLLACNGANVTIDNASVTTNAVNGNGVFSYGEGTTVNISDSKIRTSKNNSGGIQTTGGGTTNASNLDVETKGNSSAAIRSDRGGGTVVVDGGKYVTNGTGSPAIYSTADITAKNATLKANSSEGVVVEGKNSNGHHVYVNGKKLV